MADHIHMLVEIHPTIAVSDFVRELKISTNSWIKLHHEEFPYFESWGKSYCALTYAERDKETIKNYIANQKEHHKKLSFKDEYEALLRDFGIAADKWMLID